ncbi:hypothetical protein BV22DRAFT_1027802 [Leucogyrophana mollusca]|uniref:Uncharacterized protein n=1 Tax=Leucogyrophana mollusca TaxID=85980 RepID=A0ACB8C1G4_9AGAM|nr:hypothetical protein BV22DRAFT_1027802 [Leucogyrophana mollusca]
MAIILPRKVPDYTTLPIQFEQIEERCSNSAPATPTEPMTMNWWPNMGDDTAFARQGVPHILVHPTIWHIDRISEPKHYMWAGAWRR